MQTKFIKKFLYIYMFVMFFVSAYIYGIILKANGDNVEHLHTSWMVWMGQMPYKDFFQHHNPLMWYLSAPFVAYFIDSINIFSIFNIIGVAALYLIALYNCKIFLLDKNDKISALFLGAILVSAYSLLWSTDYRPDTFMFVFYYMALYKLLAYVKDEKKSLKKLILSFLYFFISFMFTQKVLMHVIVPGCFVIYWLLNGKIKLQHLFKACILPIILLCIFLCFLYYNGALEVYWLSNYPFNTYIPKIFDEQRIIFPPKEFIDFYIFLPIASFATIYFLYQGTSIERMFGLMFILETFLRMFYFSAFLHYVIFWLMTAIMLTLMLVSHIIDHLKMAKLNFIISIIGIIYLLFISWYSYHSTYIRESLKRSELNGHEYAFMVLTPCDYALNGYYTTYNLKAKDPGYYSILLGQIDVLGEKANIHKKDDLNEIIRDKLPKIVSAGVYWDTYWEQRGKKIPVHKIDSYLLNAYYDYSGVGSIYILKPQYQKYGCVYNGSEWKYIE